MKTTALLLCLAHCTVAAFSQQRAPVANTVIITGTAEAAYEPDYIIVSIANGEVQKGNSDNNYTARKEQELTETIRGLKIDTAKLTVQRFNTGNYYSLFSGSKYYINKSYRLRIDDLSRYEEIILSIANAGFKNIRIESIGVNDADRKEGELITAAINKGKAKAAIIEGTLEGKKLYLSAIEELPASYTNEQSVRAYSYYDGMGVAGGLNDIRNMPLNKVIIRKAFQISYRVEWPMGSNPH